MLVFGQISSPKFEKDAMYDGGPLMLIFPTLSIALLMSAVSRTFLKVRPKTLPGRIAWSMQYPRLRWLIWVRPNFAGNFELEEATMIFKIPVCKFW